MLYLKNKVLNIKNLIIQLNFATKVQLKKDRCFFYMLIFTKKNNYMLSKKANRAVPKMTTAPKYFLNKVTKRTILHILGDFHLNQLYNENQFATSLHFQSNYLQQLQHL